MKRKRSGFPASYIARRIILIMPSFASAPELQKNTLSANVWSTSRWASRLGPRDAVQVGHVHHLGGLLGDRLGEVRVAVAQRGSGDARAEIEEFVARPPSTAKRLRPARKRGRHGRSSATGRRSWVCNPCLWFPQRISRPRSFGAVPEEARIVGGCGDKCQTSRPEMLSRFESRTFDAGLEIS